MAEIETAEPEELEPIEIEEEEPELNAEEGEQEEEVYSIEIEGEESTEEAPLVKTLREQIRDRDRELAQHRKVNVPRIDPGPRPVWGDGSEWEYDEAAYDVKVDAWHEDVAKAKQQESDEARKAEVVNQQHQRAATNYHAKMAALPMPVEKKAAAEKAVIDALPDLWQALIVQYATDPAKVVVALGQNPAKLDAIAKETDALIVAKIIWELEKKIVISKKKPPAPESETIQRGSAPVARVTTNKAEDAALAKGEIGKFRELRRARTAASA